MKWIHERSEGITLNISLQPNANADTVVGLSEDGQYLKIKINAAPRSGDANNSLISFLAKRLKLPKRNFEIIQGQKNRRKVMFVRGATVSAASKILLSLATS